MPKFTGTPTYRYLHAVSLTFIGGKGLGMDPAGIVEGLVSNLDDGVLPVREKAVNYKCWLKGDTTLSIFSIHFEAHPMEEEPVLLRCGGESDNRPHDVAIECFGSTIILPKPLPLPPRMSLYLSIPLGLSVMLVGTARSYVPPPAKKGSRAS